VKKKSEAQIFLERVEKLDVLIENKQIEQRQWQDLAMRITANMDGERVQSTGSKSKMADAVERCLGIADEIADTIDNLIADKQKVIRVIEQVYSPTHYKILHLRYIQYMELNDIAEYLDKDYSAITTAHGRALKQVQAILNRT
jgi:DNA-directed RNA polymerase specialized sigma24 family protein